MRRIERNRWPVSADITVLTSYDTAGLHELPIQLACQQERYHITHVFAAGCKSACNRHGTCTLEDGEYRCVCSDGWAGLDCSIRLEMECNDDIDNDEG
jgi:hypothetical protein